MIKPGEIQNKARAVGVRDQQIEKDYILSWILQGIAAHKRLSISIVLSVSSAPRWPSWPPGYAAAWNGGNMATWL